MAVHMQLIETVLEHVRARIVRPLEERIAALEARLEGPNGAPDAAPAKTARARAKAVPVDVAPDPEPEATLNDVVAAADTAAAKTGK